MTLAVTAACSAPHWSEALVRLRACPEAVTWARRQPDIATAWNTCERADWLLWLLGRTDESAPWSEERKPMVRCALACSAEGLKYAAEGEAKDAAESCISITMAWCEGAATQDAVVKARRTAYAATAYAAAYAAYTAADAAAYAAAAAVDAAAAAARKRVLSELCEIVRAHYPVAPVLA